MKNIKIRHRLALGFGLVLLLLVVMLVAAAWQLTTMTRHMQQMMDVPLTKERLVSDWYANVNAGVRRTGAIARSADPSLVEFFADDVRAASATSSALQKQIEALLSNEAEKAVFERVGADRRTFIRVRDEITELKRNGDADAALDKLTREFRPAADAYLSGMLEFQKLQRDEIDALSRTLAHRARTQTIGLLVLGGLALLVGALASYLIARSITVPLLQAVTVARRVAGSDLSQDVQVDRTDELGDLLGELRHMQQALVSVVTEVQNATTRITQASGEIASGNHDLSARTEQAASNLQETAASLEELTLKVRNTADAAQAASRLASSAADIAVQGGEVGAEVVGTMHAINESAKQIADIISVIDGIAFQTNILALNAAVEAARAGEQGRGFAVVAGEVRTLAQRSATAAKEIKALISSSVQRVEVGSQLVAKAGDTMQEIVGSVQQVRGTIGDITVVTGEQSDGIGQVNTALSLLDQMTQQNAALVEQSAAAASSLQEQAQKLSALVSTFQLSSRA